MGVEPTKSAFDIAVRTTTMIRDPSHEWPAVQGLPVHSFYRPLSGNFRAITDFALFIHGLLVSGLQSAVSGKGWIRTTDTRVTTTEDFAVRVTNMTPSLFRCSTN